MLRRNAIAPVILAAGLLCAAPAVSAADKPSVQELRARADAAQGADCAQVCMEAAEGLVQTADEFFTSGDVEKAQAAMNDAVQYARKATDGSIKSGKRQKKTEIALRRLSKKMQGIDQTLAVDDRPEVEKSIAAVEKMRTDLLMSLFSKD